MDSWSESQVCPTCKGSGLVDFNYYVVSTFPLKPVGKRVCCTCDGSGKIEVEVKVR